MAKMVCRTFLLLLALWTGGHSLRAQDMAASYLSVVTDARLAGMGQAGTATSADAFSVFRNAAVTALTPSSGEAGYNFTPCLTTFLRDAWINSVGFFKNRKNKQAFLAGFRYAKYGDVALTGENGQFSEIFTPAEWDLNLGYSYAFASCFSVGAVARFIHSNVGEAVDGEEASAVAFDVSCYYQAALGSRDLLAVGVVASNFGSKLSVGPRKSSLPARLEAGASYEVRLSENASLNGSASGGCRMSPGEKPFDWGAGAECWLYRAVALRAGYHGMSDRYRRDICTFGLGAMFNHVYADFSYAVPLSDNSALEKSWSISVGINFDLFKQLRIRNR